MRVVRVVVVAGGGGGGGGVVAPAASSERGDTPGARLGVGRVGVGGPLARLGRARAWSRMAAFRFQGRVCVVTGGASGMGRALVVQLAAQGAHVACCDINTEQLDETARLARAANGGVRVSTHRVDVSDRARVEAFACEVLAAHGGQVHVLFANAGLTVPGSLLHDASMSAADVAAYEARWDRCFAVDYFGVLHCVRAFLPHIVQQDEGYIVNTASVNGFWTWPDHGAYTSAKFAVRGLTDSLLIECSVKAPHVRVASVMPGGVRTGIVRNSGYTGQGTGVVDKLFTGDGGFADLTAEEAAAWILDGVAAGKTRILVGYDAILLDCMSRFGGPHQSYAIFAALAREGVTNFDWSNLALTEKQIKNVSLLGWLRVAINGGAHFAFFTWPFALLRLRRHPLAQAAGVVFAAALLRKTIARLAKL